MAQQQAVLIGGTGYQYGDTDFLEYSERLYLDIARGCARGPDAGDDAPIAVGSALALAKQDYLAEPDHADGIDQKAVLQATLYGLPMTGFDAPVARQLGRRRPARSSTRRRSRRGRWRRPRPQHRRPATVDTPTTRGTKALRRGCRTCRPSSWLNGDDGVTVQPGAPALPKQVEDVTVAGPGAARRRLPGRRLHRHLPASAPAHRRAGDRGLDAEHRPSSPTCSSRSGWRRPTTSAPWATSGRTSLILTPGAVPRPTTPGRRAHQHRARLLATWACGSSTPATPTPSTGGNQPGAGRGAGHQRGQGHAPQRPGPLLGQGHRRPVRGRPAGVGHLDRDRDDSGHGTLAVASTSGRDPNDSTLLDRRRMTSRTGRPQRRALHRAGRQRRGGGRPRHGRWRRLRRERTSGHSESPTLSGCRPPARRSASPPVVTPRRRRRSPDVRSPSAGGTLFDDGTRLRRAPSSRPVRRARRLLHGRLDPRVTDRSDSDTASTSTRDRRLQPASPPISASAVVGRGQHPGRSQVTVTVSRGGATLYTSTRPTDSNGNVVAPRRLGRLPSGPLTVRADLLRRRQHRDPDRP